MENPKKVVDTNRETLEPATKMEGTDLLLRPLEKKNMADVSMERMVQNKGGRA